MWYSSCCTLEMLPRSYTQWICQSPGHSMQGQSGLGVQQGRTSTRESLAHLLVDTELWKVHNALEVRLSVRRMREATYVRSQYSLDGLQWSPACVRRRWTIFSGRVCTHLVYEEDTVCKHRVSAAFLERCHTLVNTVIVQISYPPQPLPIRDSLLVG